MYGFEVVRKIIDEIIDEVHYFSLLACNITFAQTQIRPSDSFYMKRAIREGRPCKAALKFKNYW